MTTKPALPSEQSHPLGVLVLQNGFPTQQVEIRTLDRKAKQQIHAASPERWFEIREKIEFPVWESLLNSRDMLRNQISDDVGKTHRILQKEALP